MIDKNSRTGRVVELHGQRAKIYIGDDYLSAVVKGKLKYGDKDVSPIAVGDYVKYSLKSDTLAAIESIEKRKAALSKPAVEKGEMLQVVVSNIDRLVIVTSIKNPAFKPGLVDRFLVTAFKENIKPVIVVNKIDLKYPDEESLYLEGWKDISCETVLTSAVTGEGLGRLKDILYVGTSVISGHSGVGKSSLLNKISPGLRLRTGPVSSSSKRGIHTTSRVSLFRVFPDGWVADTPGLKVFGLTGINKGNLHVYFPEFERCHAKCRFDDCLHIDEPDCAVKNSVKKEDGNIADFRYQSYLRIYESLEE